jgi:Kef-type K+ transport system membrane component KefB
MQEFYPFFLIIFAGVFFSKIFTRVHLPWVVALILGGIIVGPHAFDVIEITPTLDFLGQIGVIFLMFMAGLETKVSSFKEFSGGLLWLAFINGAIPFAVGILTGFLFGYEWLPSLLIGVIFVSSSIAVVIPSLEQEGLISTKLGQSVILTTILQDIASLVILSVLLQTTEQSSALPLYLFYPLLLLILVLIRLFLPKIRSFFASQIKEGYDHYQQEFRSVFLVLIGTVIIFELLGLHPIIAGFFAGLVLAESVNNPGLKEKIRTISYGIFIPTFFIVIGAQTDITVFKDTGRVLPLVLIIVFGSMLSKFVSGWIGGKMVGFSKDQSLLFAVTSIPQLSTTLAVAFSALALGIIDQKLITAMVMLSIITTIVSPVLMNVFSKRLKKAAKAKIPDLD